MSINPSTQAPWPNSSPAIKYSNLSSLSFSLYTCIHIHRHSHARHATILAISLRSLFLSLLLFTPPLFLSPRISPSLSLVCVPFHFIFISALSPSSFLSLVLPFSHQPCVYHPLSLNLISLKLIFVPPMMSCTGMFEMIQCDMVTWMNITRLKVPYKNICHIKSYQTYALYVPQAWLSRVWRIHESHFRMSHVTHTCRKLSGRIHVRVTTTDESCHTPEWIIPHTSRPIVEWVISHICRSLAGKRQRESWQEMSHAPL